jgi:hypothetical protein
MSFGEAFIMFGQVADTPFGKYMLQPDEAGGRNTISRHVVMPDAKDGRAPCARGSSRR